MRGDGTLDRARRLAGVLVCALAGSALPSSAALADTWIERPVDELRLRFRPGDEGAADAAAANVATHWRDLAAVLGTEAGEPPIVRLHATSDDLVASQPLARQVAGEWLVPSRPRRELSVLVPREPTGGAGDAFDAAALDAAVHAALARHLVAAAARGHLPEALQEGLVRFLELPTEATSARTAAGVATLRSALAADAIVPWAELSAPAGLYEQPELSLAECRAIAHFLAERNGVLTLTGLPARAAASASWRVALEGLFGASPERLESEWREWLPGYLDHGWRWHALYDGGLDVAEERIAAGDYAGAEAQLAAIAGHTARAGGETAERARRLAETAASGRLALADVDAARASLDGGDFAEAAAAAARARERLAALQLATPEAVAAEIQARARTGAVAAARLARAESAPAWSALAARRDADVAARAFARLGGDLAARHAMAVRLGLDRLLQPVGALLVALGALVSIDAWRRRRQRASVLG